MYDESEFPVCEDRGVDWLSEEEYNRLKEKTMPKKKVKKKKTKKFLWTFASYDQKDEAYSDRNIYPIKCITKMEKLNV